MIDENVESQTMETECYEDLQLNEHSQAEGKYSGLQVQFNEISEEQNYSRLLFSDTRDYGEIRLRNKKLENDLIHNAEKHLTELSRVRENCEKQMKNRIEVLQDETNELRQFQDHIDTEYNQQIDELKEVIEKGRNLQKNCFMNIIGHLENVLERTLVFSDQLENDFKSLKSRTSCLKNQTLVLEFNLKREFVDNLIILKETLPFSSGNNCDTSANDVKSQEINIKS